MATYASEVLNSDDYRNAIKEAMAKDCRYEDEHEGFEDFSSDSDHWLVIAEMLEKKDYLITELVGALEDYRRSIYEMNAAMRDGVNVQGEFSRWTAAEERVDAALTKAKETTK